jgi:outer membrane protein assembly factor BamB
MTHRLVVAIVFVALATGACSSARGSALPRPAPRPSRHWASRRPSTEPAAYVARDVVAGQVQAVWSVAADGDPIAVAGDEQGEVVIIDHERVGALDSYGHVLWVTDLDGVAGAVPALTSDRVIVPFMRENGSGGCAGLDRETGELRWTYEAIVSGGVAVAAAGSLAVCVMGNGQTAGIGIAWGGAVWEFTYSGDVDSSTIEVPAGTVIAADPADEIFAFVARIGSRWELTMRSTDTGRTRFFHDLGSGGTPSAAALIGNGYFVVASAAAGLELVSVKTHEFASFPIPVAGGFDPAGPPLRVGANIVVTGKDGEVTVFDLGALRARWTAHAPGPLRGVHPVVMRNVVMVQMWSGKLLAFRLADGARIPLPYDPGRAIGMLGYGGPVVAFAVGLDGDAGWIERWEAKPGS